MSLVGLPPPGGGRQPSSSSSLRMSLSLMRLSEKPAGPFPGEPPLESRLPSAAGQPLLCVVPLLRLPSSESSEWPLPGSPGHSLLQEFLRPRRDLEEAARRAHFQNPVPRASALSSAWTPLHHWVCEGVRSGSPPS